jgi:hypothetical protein
MDDEVIAHVAALVCWRWVAVPGKHMVGYWPVNGPASWT